MKRRDILTIGTLGLASTVAPPLAAQAAVAKPKPAGGLAPTPPMGWNSWNSFATTINEAQSIEQATIMARELLPAGYDVFTVDIQWYEPGASSYNYSGNPQPTMDGFGRLLPAPNRFPSARGGAGFAPLASRVHALGLRFGVHLMRGIPRLAVERNLPVFGTKLKARDIADTTSTCSWNPDMFGVDMKVPGAQAYYDSVFALLASWGVDFVKVDDLSRPYDAHASEIEAIAAGIRNSGRPMLLSMSPGETPVARGAHARANAQMWRISDDFWDDWGMLAAQFVRLANWNLFMGNGGWPDADMLPLGRLALGERDTHFTPAEQRTLMTLWSIARSPLIMGGDLRHLDAATQALLTNPEVIAVNQASSANQPLYAEDNINLWTARAPNGDRYLAMFNIGDEGRDVAVNSAAIGVTEKATVRDLWQRKADGVATSRFSRKLAPHGAGLYRFAAS